MEMTSIFIPSTGENGGGGAIDFLAVCQSVCPSVRLSVSPIGVCPLDFFELFSVVLWDIDLKFYTRLCLGMIQIKFDFCRVTYFYMIYWLPFTKISIVLASEILNFTYEFVLTWYRSTSTFVTFDLLFLHLL